jgi:uroporphyrin-III C-methyltransferase/precorrin-2 dehydrogenase/sirohydrochlorin ferrochelatase
MRGEAVGFAITLDVEGQAVLVVGDDADAARKRSLLEDAGARVTQLAPAVFSDGAVDGAKLVLSSARDPALAARVSAAARARGIPVWCSDDPACSDFAMPAVAQLGPVRLAISTSGGSPTLAGRLRAIFETQLGARFAAFGRALAARRPARTIDERRADVDGFELELRVRYPDWFDDAGGD